MVAADKESVSHILSREGGGNLLAILVGGVQESLNARPGAYKLVLQNRLHQACPDARVLGRGLWIQLEIGKDCSLERRLHRQMQILFWQGESQSIDSEDSVLVIHVLSHAQIPREYSRRKIL